MRLRLVPVECKVCPECAKGHTAGPPQDTTPLRGLSDLNKGDAVFHARYGMGIFRGVEMPRLRAVEGPYLRIDYEDGTVVYLPPDRPDSLKRYAGSAPPQLTRHDAASGLYEGGQCPWCKTPFDPRTTRRVTRDRLVLVDVDPPVYERELRYACRQCDNLYEAVQCPLCDTAKPKHTTTVYVRTFAVQESLAELEAREVLAVDGEEEEATDEGTTEPEGDDDAADEAD
jgi:hypothetical protein